jgi:hypothetical protein
MGDGVQQGAAGEAEAGQDPGNQDGDGQSGGDGTGGDQQGQADRLPFVRCQDRRYSNVRVMVTCTSRGGAA